MSASQSELAVQNMQQKTTEELLAILLENDSDQWSDTAFEAVRLTLRERGVEAISQALSERPDQVIIQPTHPYEGVRGWLLILCISLTILNPLSIIASLGAVSTSDMFHDFRPSFLIYEILGLIFAGIFIHIGVCLWRVRPGAVKKAKVFLWCVIALNAILILVTFMVKSTSPDSKGKCIANAFSALIWLIYLGSSKRVKATYDMHSSVA